MLPPAQPLKIKFHQKSSRCATDFALIQKNIFNITEREIAAKLISVATCKLNTMQPYFKYTR